jgi:hypothetical protein
VNHTDIYFYALPKYRRRKQGLYPDELGGGFKKYMELEIENSVFEFMCTYVRRIKPDVK